MLIPIDDAEALEIWDSTCPEGFAQDILSWMREERTEEGGEH